jgi:hypothetical protein
MTDAERHPMMKCGHAANSTRVMPDGSRIPSCVICAGLTPDAYTPTEEPNLAGRMARCGCGKERPSVEREQLAFFEFCGPGPRTEGHATDRFYCGCRGWD